MVRLLKNSGYSASPDYIDIDNNDIIYTEHDAFTFLFSKSKGILIVKGSTHNKIVKMYSLEQNDVYIEGRMWIEHRIMSFWTNSFRCPSYQEMTELVKRMQSYNIDIKNFTIAISFYHYIVMLSVNEYIQRKLSGNEQENDFIQMAMSEQKKQRQNNINMPQTKTGINSKNFWRHYEIVGEEQIRFIIRESLKKIFNI